MGNEISKRIIANAAELSAYADRHADKGLACSLTDLSAASFTSGYRFSVQCISEAKGIAKYELTAEPLEFGQTGIYGYCITESRITWYDQVSAAASLSTKRPFRP